MRALSKGMPVTGNNKSVESNQNSSMQIWDNVWKRMDIEHQSYYTSGKADTFVKFSTMMGNEYIGGAIFPKAGGLASLECGCGRADISNYFASRRGYKVTCLDFSEAALKIARENFRQEGNSGDFIKGSVSAIPFGDDTFDIVFCMVLLELFDDVQSVVNEMVRVLKPGGIFFAGLLILSRKFNVSTLARVIYQAIMAPAVVLRSLSKGQVRDGLQKAIRMFQQPYFTNSYSLAQYKEFMRCAGLDEVRIDGFCPFPYLELPNLLRWLEKLYLRIVIAITWVMRKLRRTHPWVSNANWSVFQYAYGRKSG